MYRFVIVSLLILGPAPAIWSVHSSLDQAHAAKAAAKSPEEAAQTLLEGNARFVTGKVKHPNLSAERREEVAKGQNPFAIVVGCADSRVPPEAVFDQGLGDLFVVRVAGNVVDDAAIGSIEYAAEHLNVPLIVVLTHERCGAVKATLDGGEPGGHIGSLVKDIAPAVEEAKKLPGDKLDNAVRLQAARVAAKLRDSMPVLHHLTESGKLMVVAARYDLDSGVVELLSSSPAAKTAAIAAPVEEKKAAEKHDEGHGEKKPH